MFPLGIFILFYFLIFFPLGIFKVEKVYMQICVSIQEFE